jgi:hypothetical protein
MQRLISFPQHSLLFVGHDYPPEGLRRPMTGATVGEHRKIWENVAEDSFVEWRKRKDSRLGAPRLLHPSLQVNIRGGRLPPKGEKGWSWLKTPIRGVEV